MIMSIMKTNKQVPNFLCIGTMKAGTSWLYDILKTHNEIFLPFEKKELHYFDNNYHKGFNWYMSFFEKSYPEVKGEITPTYLDNINVPKRVKKELGNNMKIIVILRNPVERAYSSYKYKTMKGKAKGNFKEVIDKNPSIIEKGHYYKHLKNWFKEFEKDNFHIVIFEEMIKEPENTINSICDFLCVDKNYDKKKLFEKSNQSHSTRFLFIYKHIEKLGEWLRKNDFDRIVNFVKKSNILKVFKSNKKNSVTKEDLKTKKKLYDYYLEDIKKLEKLINKDLTQWKNEK